MLTVRSQISTLLSFTAAKTKADFGAHLMSCTKAVTEVKVKRGVGESRCHKRMLQSAEQLRNISVLEGFQATLYTGPCLERNKTQPGVAVELQNLFQSYPAFLPQVKLFNSTGQSDF